MGKSLDCLPLTKPYTFGFSSLIDVIKLSRNYTTIPSYFPPSKPWASFAHIPAAQRRGSKLI